MPVSAKMANAAGLGDSDIDSGSESDLSEGARAARDRLAPKTQADYASFMRSLTTFVLERPALFSEFIENEKVVLPVPLPVGKAYLAHCRDTMVPWPLDPRLDAARTSLRHYSTQKINGTINAIKHSFVKVSAPMPSHDAVFFNNFARAYRQIISQAKAHGEYPSDGGAVALDMMSVIRLLIAALNLTPTGRGAKESSIRRMWLFLLLSIATCGRGERIGRVQFQFISWFADCLTVQIPTSKSDIEGLMSYAKLCAANPWNPACCLVTALGVEFLSRDETSSVQFLFGNANDSTNYMVNQMQTALKSVLHVVGETNLGALFHQLTGHFLKKTGVGFMRSCHECVSHDSRELRADHKVGPYNLRSEQDGIVARVLAFLKPGSVEFAVAPPHFHPDVVAAVPWAEFVPHYDKYSPETKLAIHACVASVIHNTDFIAKNLSKSHSFHGCRLLKTQSKWIKLLQPHVMGGRSSFKSILQPTGHSLMSKIAVDLEMIRKGGSGRATSAADSQALVEHIVRLETAVTHLTQVIEGQATVTLHPNTTASSQIFIGYLSEKFPFPVGLSIEDCWRRWHCGDKPLRAINTKMLLSTLTAAEKLRQCCLRRKMKAVMEILQGQTAINTVDMDPEFVWHSCWARAVSLFNIPQPCTWVLSTAYDFFLRSPLLVKAARTAASVHVPDVAVAAAATAVKAAQDATAFAVAAAAHRPVRALDVAVVASDQANDEGGSVMSRQHVDSIVESISIHTVQLGGAPRDAVAPAHAPDTSLLAPLSLSSLPLDSTQLHAHWPQPTNSWIRGATQCARCCKSCRKAQWQATDKLIQAHFRHHHDCVPQLKPGIACTWLIEETAWCVKGLDADGVALVASIHDGGLCWTPVQDVMRGKRPRTNERTCVLDAAERNTAQLQAVTTYQNALMHVDAQADAQLRSLADAQIQRDRARHALTQVARPL